MLLIGNYPPDHQESMQRFASLLQAQLQELGCASRLISPGPILTRFVTRRSRLWKWLGYIDKLIFFPIRLIKHRGASVIHICDHSNAIYGRWFPKERIIVTCHDLLAVRGGLGEETNCPPTRSGRFLQRWILSSLGRIKELACVSSATARDAHRLVKTTTGAQPKISVIENGLNYPYRRISEDEAWHRLASWPRLRRDRPFVLHVGSNLARKNREGFLRIMAEVNDTSAFQLVFAGEPLSLEMCNFARSSDSEVIELISPDSPILEALYRLAHALLFPSRFEGFGWPIIEAQACGCPVVCSRSAPMGEIAGAAALQREVKDEAGFAADILRLRDPQLREKLRFLAQSKAGRFSARAMAERYLAVYRQIEKAAA